MSGSRTVVVSATSLVNDSGTTARLSTTLHAIEQLGLEPGLLVGFESPSYFRSRDHIKRRQQLLEEVGWESIFLPLWPKRGPGGRTTTVRAAGLSLRPILRSRRPDKIIAINADAAAACGMAGRAGLARVRILEMHGLESEEAIYSGAIERASMDHRRRQHIERYAISWATDVVAPAPAAQEWAEANRLPAARWHVLPTLPALKATNDEIAQDRASTRSALGFDDKRVLLYIGGLHEWQQPDLMVRTFAHLLEIDDRWRFLFLTPNPAHAEDFFSDEMRSASNYRTMYVPHDKLRQVAVAGDMALLLREEHLMNRLASPAKFGEYLELGIPVAVTTATPSLADVLNQCHAGVSLPPGSTASEFAQAISGHIKTVPRDESTIRCRNASSRFFGEERANDVYRTILQDSELNK